MRDSEARQFSFFEKQLELAQVANKPVVLHIVRAFDEALRVLQLFGLPEQKGFVHAFNGSAKQAEAYLQLGLLISVGGAACRPDNQRLHQAIAAVPLDRLLLETDSPDQPAPDFESSRPSMLWKVAESVAKIKGLSSTEVLDKTSQNLRKLLQL
jgi:TatD DNase family protein